MRIEDTERALKIVERLMKVATALHASAWEEIG